MANFREPNPGEEEAYLEWVATKPAKIQEVAKRFRSWKLYRLKSSNHRVAIYSFREQLEDLETGEPLKDPLVTITVFVSGRFNYVAFERNVFGISPEDLEECDLPGPDEWVGSADIPIDVAVDLFNQLEAERQAKN